VTVSAALSDEQSLDDVKKIIVDTVADLARQAPTKEEVDRAKTRIIQGWIGAWPTLSSSRCR